MQHRFNRLFSVTMAAALLAGTSAGAAELGDIAVRSYLNQPLTADIELVMLTPDEAAEGVPVRLAGPNIYQGANVRMHPALTGARMSVQRKDQRLFVHLVTLQPVDADVLHLYLELGAGSRAVVRAATLWLTAEPPGAPRPPVARPAPAQVAGASESSPSSSRAAAPLRPAPLPPPVDMARLAMVPVHPTPAPPPTETATPPAASATADPALPGFAPSQAALLAARARAAAEREALMRRAAYGTDLLKQAPRQAACVTGKSGEQAKQCVALDQKNTELNAKIRDLEGKVQALQVAVGAPVTGQPAAGGAPAAGGGAAASPASAAAAASAAMAASAGTAASAVPSAAAAEASAPLAASAPAASAPMNPAGAVIPPSNGANGTNGKKERRSGLNATTQIVLGVLAAITLLGGLAYMVRKNKLKLPPKEKLMFWKRWKRNKQDDAEAPPAEPQEPVLDKDGE